MRNLIQDEIRDYLSYNPDTGDLIWIKKTGRSTPIGNVAGSVNADGYLVTRFKGVLYFNHRIAWFLHTGKQPSEHIDHIDVNPLNNTFINLREATESQNMHNRGKYANNTSGYKGVCWDKKNRKWLSKIGLEGRYRNLGRFSTKEEAYSAYCKAADELHKQFANYQTVVGGVF